MIDYHEAIREMYKGNVVKYVGTVNGDVMTDRGASFCMCRGCVFPYNGEPIWRLSGRWVYDPELSGRMVYDPELSGRMVYDPDFLYVLTGETIDPRAWRPDENRDRKDIKSKLGYSRIGLGNV